MIAPAELRRVFGYFATGVTVVTAVGRGGPCGLTVNSFASLSLDPPLLLVCVNSAARAYPCLAGAGTFAVNVLARGQEELARRFASLETEKFVGLTYRQGPATGAPVIAGVHAWLECRLAARHPGGRTHAIFVGAIEGFGTGEDEPLLFHRGAYTRLIP
ncbi:MAG: flavin reductase family protein [Candidatus Limnocylindria bacterium]